jgi:hypothetical protein
MLSRGNVEAIHESLSLLAPFVILLVDPANRSRRQDRNPAIGRQNLLWVIDGHPGAVPLFK